MEREAFSLPLNTVFICRTKHTGCLLGKPVFAVFNLSEVLLVTLAESTVCCAASPACLAAPSASVPLPPAAPCCWPLYMPNVTVFSTPAQAGQSG